MVTKNTQILYKLEVLHNKFNDHYSHNEREERWSLYLEIFELLIHNQNEDYINKINYLLSSGENINEVFINIINNDDDLYFILYPYIGLLTEYLNLDNIKFFL